MFTAFVFIINFGSVNAQQSHQCSHKTSFEKSWISDTLDAISLHHSPQFNLILQTRKLQLNGY